MNKPAIIDKEVQDYNEKVSKYDRIEGVST
jgi:hypothetical protein